MNFTEEIKRDLLRAFPQNRCCRLATFAAFLDTRGIAPRIGENAESAIVFTSEKEEIAEYFLSLAEELFGISMTVTEAVRDPKYGRNKLTFSYAGGDAAAILEEIKRCSAEKIGGAECCVRAYLCGAFLGGGSCTLPRGGAKTGYHLEFVFRRQSAALAFCELLEGQLLFGNMIPRGEKYVVYCKNREMLGDFLYKIGARGALRKFESVFEAREQSNRDNRVNNCFIGNTDKTAIASAEQVFAVQRLEEKGILQTLSEPLRRAAEGRVRYPTLSLNELAAVLGVGKSCLNHRMRKLVQLSTRTEENA